MLLIFFLIGLNAHGSTGEGGGIDGFALFCVLRAFGTKQKYLQGRLGRGSVAQVMIPES